MKKRGKVETTIGGLDELERVLGEYAEACIERDRLAAELDERVRVQRELYEGVISAEALRADALLADMEAWAALHPELFAPVKRVETLHGCVGWRTSPPAVRQARGVRAEHSVELAERAGLTEWVRTAKRLDKEAVLSDWATGVLAEGTLKAVGLRIVQEEKFYADLKREGGE
jgi:phage host-nuclease inhibitor protein Gam